jgi:hypothetical protein
MADRGLKEFVVYGTMPAAIQAESEGLNNG